VRPPRPDHELALASGGHRIVPFVDHVDFIAGHRLAAGTYPSLAQGIRQGNAAFRESVPFQEKDAEALFERGQHLAHRAGAPAQPDAMATVGQRWTLLEENRDHHAR